MRSLLVRCLHLIVAGMLLAAIALPGAAWGASVASYAPSEVLVKLYQATDLPALAATYALNPAALDQFGTRPIYRLQILDGAAPPDKVLAMSGDPRIQYVDVNTISAAPESQGFAWSQGYAWSQGFAWSQGGATTYANQWAGLQMRLPQANAVTTGSGMVVAVLDTGIDPMHPAFAGRLVPGFDFVDNDTDPTEVGSHAINPAFGHGTMVAGLVAFAAPGAKIMPLRVLDPNGMGNEWVLAEALQYAATHGANIINLSLAMPDNDHLLREVLNAVACGDPTTISANDIPCYRPDGAVVVEAAGNFASQTAVYPAGFSVKGTLSVGASEPTDILAPFSNYGSWVGVEAPGDFIVSTVPGGGTGVWAGTSMAVPLVAGEAALVRGQNPTLGTADVVSRIKQTADLVVSTVRLRVDAAAAVGLP